MMPFWDRFVIWVYLGLADTLPRGRDAVASLFTRAHAAGHIDPTRMSDLSVLLVAGVCRTGSPLRVGAEAEIPQRKLSTEYEWTRSAQSELRGSRLTEVLELNRPRQPLQSQLFLGVLTEPPGHETWRSLIEFWSRVNAAEPAPSLRRATILLTEAVTRYYRFPIGTVDFLSLAFRLACGQLGLAVTPLAIPAPGEGWPGVIDPDEGAFLTRCAARLSDPDRVLLFLSFYGQLTAEQITGLLRFMDRNITLDGVVFDLERCWGEVL